MFIFHVDDQGRFSVYDDIVDTLLRYCPNPLPEIYRESYMLQRNRYINTLRENYGLDKIAAQHGVSLDDAVSQLYHIRAQIERKKPGLSEVAYKIKSMKRLKRKIYGR